MDERQSEIKKSKFHCYCEQKKKVVSNKQNEKLCAYEISYDTFSKWTNFDGWHDFYLFSLLVAYYFAFKMIVIREKNCF